MLVAAANPCPCGRGEADPECSCSPLAVQRYQGRLSGALADRIDILAAVRQPSAEEIGGAPGEPSAAVRERVAAARGRAQQEQVGLLRHHPDGAAQRVEAEIADVDAVDQDGALGHVVEAGGQIAERSLAGPGLAHDRHAAARGRDEVDVPQDRAAGLVVVEPDVAELDLAGGTGRVERRRVGRLLDLDRQVEVLDPVEQRRRGPGRPARSAASRSGTAGASAAS